MATRSPAILVYQSFRKVAPIDAFSSASEVNNQHGAHLLIMQGLRIKLSPACMKLGKQSNKRGLSRGKLLLL